jgi:hypothetical protein
MFVLFGELRYDIGVITDVEPTGPRAWLCDYREKHPAEFSSLTSMAAAFAERLELFGGCTALHLERLRGQLLGPAATARVSETPLAQLADD